MPKYSTEAIRTIALVHETLSREAGDDIDFVEIVHPLARMAEESLQSPDRPVHFRVEGDDVRMMVQYLVAELAPDQLGEPRLRARAAALRASPGLARELPHRHRAEAQVDAEVAGALERGKVARARVVGDAADELAPHPLAAVLGAGMDDDLNRALARTDAIAAMLGTDDGKNLLAGFRRAANILRIEERKDGPHDGAVDADRLEADEERALAAVLDRVAPAVAAAVACEQFTDAVSELASLRPYLDAFFDKREPAWKGR